MSGRLACVKRVNALCPETAAVVGSWLESEDVTEGALIQGEHDAE
jgi:hypothetical protein